MKNTDKKMTKEEWYAEGERRFGKDQMKWKFICPACGYIATPKDWKDAGVDLNTVAFSCVGRWLGITRKMFERDKRGPCDYAGGGLFRLNPMKVDGVSIFDFAPEE
jgi:hypothetical protein